MCVLSALWREREGLVSGLLLNRATLSFPLTASAQYSARTFSIQHFTDFLLKTNTRERGLLWQNTPRLDPVTTAQRQSPRQESLPRPFYVPMLSGSKKGKRWEKRSLVGVPMLMVRRVLLFSVICKCTLPCSMVVGRGLDIIILG